MSNKGFNNVLVGLTSWMLEVLAVAYDTLLLPIRLVYLLLAPESY